MKISYARADICRRAKSFGCVDVSSRTSALTLLVSTFSLSREDPLSAKLVSADERESCRAAQHQVVKSKSSLRHRCPLPLPAARHQQQCDSQCFGPTNTYNYRVGMKRLTSRVSSSARDSLAVNPLPPEDECVSVRKLFHSASLLHQLLRAALYTF